MSHLLKENGLEPLDYDDRRETLPNLPAGREPVAPEGPAHSAHAGGVWGTLLTIIDSRDGRIPSQRFNSFDLISTTDLDIDCIEVSLGPGSAPYGPNAAAGVMHIITASPIDRPGTSVSLAGGEHSIFSSRFRSAHAFSGRFGIRVSGRYMRGNDFGFQDPIEVAAAPMSTHQVHRPGCPRNSNAACSPARIPQPLTAFTISRFSGSRLLTDSNWPESEALKTDHKCLPEGIEEPKKPTSSA